MCVQGRQASSNPRRGASGRVQGQEKRQYGNRQGLRGIREPAVHRQGHAGASPQADLQEAHAGPCTGSEYATDAEFFRAYASAQSSDATASKKKAMTGARTALENQIKTKAEAAAKSQTKISGADIAQFNSLIQGVIQQEVVKMKVICENSEQAGGRYKTHIVVEVTKASVLTNIVNSAKSDEKLKANFEEGKFKQAF